MKHLVRSIFLFFMVAVFITGCKKADETQPKPGASKEKAGDVKKTGVTDEFILIGQWGPQTGPAALWGAVARGTQAYFEMINAQGGIHGRKLKLLIRDDAYQPPRTKAAVMELVEKKGVFAFVGGVGTGPGMAVKDYLAEKKIPWIGPASGSSNWAKKPGRYLFSLYPTYEIEATILTRHLLDQAGVERIAFLYQNDDYGKEGLFAARAELEKRGLSLVSEVSLEVSDQDLNSHVLKLKTAKPDAVIMWVLPKHGAITLTAAAKLNFHPLWASTSALADAPLMHRISKGLWEGVIFNSFGELPDSDHPLMLKYRHAYETYGLKNNPAEEWGTFFLGGILFAEPLVEAIKRAGPDLDREKLVDALETLDHWNGGTGHDITFGPGQRQGQRSIFICRCENGKAVRITDWITME